MENSYMKKGGKWIQKATASIKRRKTEGVCTGAKFGGPTCPKGSKRYNLAKTFKAISKRRGSHGMMHKTGNKNPLKQAYMKSNY